MSERYDVIVIGGGVAGLSTAANITEGNVLLIEKDRIKTQEKGYLRFSFQNSMDRFGLSNCVLTRYNVLSFRSITGSKFDFHFEDHEMVLLDLGKIHSTLKSHIEKKHGFREKIEIVDVKQNNQKVEVEISENNDIKTIYAKYLVDASGNEFFTRKKFNLKCSDLFCTCFGAMFENGYTGEINVLTLILPSTNFKCGGWIYPLDNDYSFGIADALRNMVSPDVALSEQFNKVQKDPTFRNIIQGGIRQDWDMGVIPLGISNPLVFGRICYIGDVVGQANPWNALGIRPILELSIMCANAINLALKQDDKTLLENYQNNWDSTYGEVYSNYNHWGKWSKSTKAWKETSMNRMLNEFEFNQKNLVDQLRYYNLPEKKRFYLETLTANFC
jgi:flavin-dependent dehydrogenase